MKKIWFSGGIFCLIFIAMLALSESRNSSSGNVTAQSLAQADRQRIENYGALFIRAVNADAPEAHTKALLEVFAQQPPPKPTDKAAQLKAALQQKLDEWRANGKFPGATVGVVLADGTTFGLATGVSDVAANKAMKPNDRLLPASVGKTYVAAVTLQLVKEGKLKLDDKLEKYLGREPWFDRLPNARAITVRHLLNHTSGFVQYLMNPKFLADLKKDPDKVWKPQELLAYLFETKAAFAPGQGWDYSDANYIAVGMIIERVTKSTYYEQLRKRILKPLKLNDTVPADSRRVPGLVQGYAGANNHFGGPFSNVDAMLVNGELAVNLQFEWTGGGLASTSEDLARWGKLLYEGKAFDPALLTEMLTGVPASFGQEVKYGLGVIINSTRLGVSYGHSGREPGYTTEMMYFPKNKLALAVQVNTSEGSRLGKSPDRVLVELAELIAGPQSGQDQSPLVRDNPQPSPDKDTIYKNEAGQVVTEDEFTRLRYSGPRNAVKLKTDAGRVVEMQLVNVEKVLAMERDRQAADAKASGQPAPAFTATTLDGKEISLAALKGKVVVLNFWSTACAPCLSNLPELNKLVEKHQSRNDIVFLAPTSAEAALVKTLLSTHDFKYQVIPAAQRLADAYQVGGYTHVVIGKNGLVVKRFSGLRGEETNVALVAAVEEALKAAN